MSATRVHLVRHGEVENPHHVVYADLPGYGLSPLGFDQADRAAARLADAAVGMVVSSPLLRARQTAAAIAQPHGLDVLGDPRLTEWLVAMRWAGVRWSEIDVVFPGELTAYLEHPLELSFGVESIPGCGRRVAAAVRSLAESATNELVVVGHQDPTHAGHLALTGRLDGLAGDGYHRNKPAHAAVISLQPEPADWRDLGYWEPAQGAGFPPVE